MQKKVKPSINGIINKYSAVVPVAGLSSRFGSFKPLFEIDGETLIHRTVRSLLQADVSEVVVITGYNSEKITSALDDCKEQLIFCENLNYKVSDMLTSIKIGISKLSTCNAFFVLPADMPFISSTTVKYLYNEFEEKDCKILIPVYEGRRRHPPLISFSIKNEIIDYNGKNGLKGFFDYISRTYLLSEVMVDDLGVTVDIDTVNDCEKIKCINLK